jgi:SAM-dependent methyltransferase
MDKSATLRQTFRLQRIYQGMFEEYLAQGFMKDLDPTDAENQFTQDWQIPHYYDVGADALKNILHGLTIGLREPPKSILDLPSGSGRVTRHLKAFFPEARVVACDLYEPHVNFCRDVLGVESIVSTDDLKDLRIGEFDVIFCGSLLTHLPAKTFASAMKFLARSLTTNGIAVVTTHGRHVEFAQKRKYGIIQHELFDIAAKGVVETGFGYVDYHHDLMSTAWDKNENYGVSLSRPSYTMKLLEQNYDIRILCYTERGWDAGQDVIIFGRPGVNGWMRSGDVSDPMVIHGWTGPEV